MPGLTFVDPATIPDDDDVDDREDEKQSSDDKDDKDDGKKESEDKDDGKNKN